MDSSAATHLRPSRLYTAGLALALFFIVVGTKWAVIDRFGSDIPNQDQWDGEGLHLLVPWFENGAVLHELFLPHNEHRVVVTKLQSLALVLISGQWDTRSECVVNALLHSALAVALWITGRRWLTGRWHAPLFVLIATLFGLPLAWENILGGFQSQEYWLLGLSFVTVVVFPFASSWTVGWWAAAAAAALTLLTMGSGLLASTVVMSVVAFRVWHRDTTLRAALPTLVWSASVLAIGIATRVVLPGSEALHSHSADEFLLYVFRSLQWPLPANHGWLAPLVWLPWVLAAARVITSADRADACSGQAIVAMGGWVLLQLVATAYARGAGADYPAPRYLDTLDLGLAFNGLALGWLLSPAAAQCGEACRPTGLRGPLVACTALGAAWIVAIAGGLYDRVERDFYQDLPAAKTYYLHAEVSVQNYLATNDRVYLATENIPYLSADGLISRLAHASLRDRVPPSVRPPLKLTPAAPVRGFLENFASPSRAAVQPQRGLSAATAPLSLRTTWGSFGDRGRAATGEWTSAPLVAPLHGWLVFETAGQIGEPGTSLELHDAQSGARLAEVRPTKVPGDTWRAAYVRAPHAPFVIVARDDDPTRWIAFSEPVEMSSLSHLAWQAAKNGLLVAEMGATTAALLGLASLARLAPVRQEAA